MGKHIFTPRLTLRPFIQRDLQDFYTYASQPLVGPMAGWKTHESLDESQGILDSFILNEALWALEHRQDGKVIGSIGLHPDSMRTTDGVRMMGYAMSQDYWGQGLMPEAAKAIMIHAFQDLGVQLLSITHYSFNNQSRRVIEKLGYLYEGTLRHARKLPDGQITDLVCYAITKEEFLKL